MALIYSSVDLTNLAAQFQCCSAVLAKKALDAEMYQSSDKKCLLNKLYFLNKAVCIITGYTPAGSLLEAGYVASSTIDLNSFASFGDLFGVVVVNGNTIGVLPEGTYSTIDELIDGLVAAIAAGGSGYTAVNNGDGTITVSAASSATSANGFEISILINPDFILDTELTIPGTQLRQMLHVENNTSNFNEYILIAQPAGANHYVHKLFNKALVQSKQTFGGAIISGSGSYALVHDEANDRVLTVANVGANAWILDSGLNNTGTIAVSASVFAVFNPMNDCVYFSNPVGNNIRKVTSGGTVTNIAAIAQINPTPTTNHMAVDTSGTATDGFVWILCLAGAAGIKRIHPTTDVISNINTGAEQAACITYYPGDGTPGSERMFVGFNSGLVRAYNLDGTVATATFYTSVGAASALLYSRVHNVLLISGSGGDILVVRMDGSLRQTITGGDITFFVEDTTNNLIVGHNGTNEVRYYILGDSGSDEFTSILEDGVPDTFSDGSENCLTEAEITNVIETAKEICCQIDY